MLIVEALASLFGVDHYNPPVKLGKPFCVKGFEVNRGDTQAIAVLGSVSLCPSLRGQPVAPTFRWAFTVPT